MLFFPAAQSFPCLLTNCEPPEPVRPPNHWANFLFRVKACNSIDLRKRRCLSSACA